MSGTSNLSKKASIITISNLLSSSLLPNWSDKISSIRVLTHSRWGKAIQYSGSKMLSAITQTTSNKCVASISTLKDVSTWGIRRIVKCMTWTSTTFLTFGGLKTRRSSWLCRQNSTRFERARSLKVQVGIYDWRHIQVVRSRDAYSFIKKNMMTRILSKKHEK